MADFPLNTKLGTYNFRRIIVWEAIAYVSSGVTLVAFISSIIAWTYKSKTDERERLIRTAKPEQRADLIRNALEFFHVDTTGLTKEQQYKLALEQIRSRAQRYEITAIVICFLVIIAASVTIYAIKEHNAKQDKTTAEAETRFDVKFGRANFLKIGNKIRSEITLHAIPLTNKNEEAATIFTGLMVIHNEAAVDINKDTSSSACKNTTSCLGAKVFTNFSKEPIIVRGGNTEPVNITWFFEFSENLHVKYIRIYWEFYQKEANNNGICVIDDAKQSPTEGIPYLKVISKGGADTKDVCWRALDMTVIQVSI